MIYRKDIKPVHIAHWKSQRKFRKQVGLLSAILAVLFSVKMYMMFSFMILFYNAKTPLYQPILLNILIIAVNS